MKKKYLSVSMTLPILMVGLGQALTNFKVNNQENLQAKLSVRTSQATLTIQQPSPFLMAARDNKEKQCRWLGICDQ